MSKPITLTDAQMSCLRCVPVLGLFPAQERADARDALLKARLVKRGKDNRLWLTKSGMETLMRSEAGNE